MKVKKHEWLIIIGAVFVAWFIDIFTKQMALSFIPRGYLEFFGPIGFVLHRNPGAMLGMFADLPPVLRIVTLSTGGAFLVFVYAVIQYLLPMRSIMLRLGMSFLLGGILGNVTDRTIWGSVVDFLIIGKPGFSTPAFNFADAIQWVGYAMVVIALIRDGQQLWPTENTRKHIWVNPKFQLKYCFILVAVGLAFSLLSGVFTYTYFQVMIDEIVIGSTARVHKQFIIPFVLTYIVLSLGFVIFLFLIGRVLSHRTAGPLYAFELFLEDIIKGKDRPLRLRSHDEFQHLEELGNRLLDEIRETHLNKNSTTDETVTVEEKRKALS